MAIYKVAKVSEILIAKLINLSEGITLEKINDFFISYEKNAPEDFRFEKFYDIDGTVISNNIARFFKNKEEHKKLDNFFNSSEFKDFFQTAPNTDTVNKTAKLNWKIIKKLFLSSYHLMNEFPGLKKVVLETSSPKALYSNCSSPEHLQFLIDNKVPQYQQSLKEVWLPLFAIHKIFLVKKASPIVFHDEVKSLSTSELYNKRYTITESNNKVKQTIDTINNFEISSLSEINKNSLASLLSCNGVQKNHITLLKVSQDFKAPSYRIGYENKVVCAFMSTPFKNLARSNQRENLPSNYELNLDEWMYVPLLNKSSDSQSRNHTKQNNFLTLNISLLDCTKEDEKGRNAADMLLHQIPQKTLISVSRPDMNIELDFLDSIKYWFNTFNDKKFNLYRKTPEKESSPFTNLYLSQFKTTIYSTFPSPENILEDQLHNLPEDNKEIINKFWIDNAETIIDNTMDHLRRNNTNFEYHYNPFHALINQYINNPSKELENVFIEKFPEIQLEHDKKEKRLHKIDSIYPKISAIVASIKIKDAISNSNSSVQTPELPTTTLFKL